MPTGKAFPRLSILQNFKEINRIMTSTFLKNKMLDAKFQGRLPHDYQTKRETELQSCTQLTRIMQKMHSPRNFTGELLKCGSKISYQNVSLAKSLMLSKERSIIARRNNHAKSVALKMNSLLNNSSHFD